MSPADPDQLFDLDHDPGKRDNRADNSLRVALVADSRALRWDLAELDPRLSQRRRCVVDAALSGGNIYACDFHPLRNASKQYIRNNMELGDFEAEAAFHR